MHGTADEVAAKWLARIQQSADVMKAGVERVRVAPGQAAAAKKSKWVMAMQDQATQDKWERNVRSVSLASWVDSMVNIGINRVAAGAQAKQQKYINAIGPLLQYIDQGVANIRNMPDDTFEQRLARSTAMQRWMHEYQRPSGG